MTQNADITTQTEEIEVDAFGTNSTEDRATPLEEDTVRTL